MPDAAAPFPEGSPDEATLLLRWLGYLRGAVVRKLEGLDEERGHAEPARGLLSLLGIVQHLGNVEWRWIDGGFRGATVSRHEEEFHPPSARSIEAVLEEYRRRAAATDEFVRTHSLDEVAAPDGWARGSDLRFVVLHLIQETARHAGHADATRTLLDGASGE